MAYLSPVLLEAGLEFAKITEKEMFFGLIR
jgi:hypothetical protein